MIARRGEDGTTLLHYAHVLLEDVSVDELVLLRVLKVVIVSLQKSSQEDIELVLCLLKKKQLVSLLPAVTATVCTST